MNQKIILNRYFDENIQRMYSLDKDLSPSTQLSNLPPLFFYMFKDKLSLKEYSLLSVLPENMIIRFLGNKDLSLTYSIISKKYNIAFLNHIKKYLTPTDFFYVSQVQELNENFITENLHLLNNKKVSSSQKLSLDFIRKHENWINFEALSSNSFLTNEIYQKYKSRINLNHYFSVHKSKFNKELLLANYKYIDSYILSSLDCDDETTEVIKDRIDWNIFSTTYHDKITENFILKNIKNINLYEFTKVNYLLSLDFILNNINKLDIRAVLSYRTDLSSEIIDKYNNYISWNSFSSHINLSDDELEKYKNKISLLDFIHYNISKNFNFIKKNFLDKNLIDFERLSYYQSIPFNFFKTYIDKFNNKRRVINNNNYSEDNLKRIIFKMPIYDLYRTYNISDDFKTYLELKAFDLI